MITGQETRDRFDHRICTDLCELILSFLSIEDKIRFEAVSLQFKESVFRRQYRFDGQLIVKYLTRFPLNDVNRYRGDPSSIDWSPIACFFSKCPNLIAIEIPHLRLSSEQYDRLFNTVIDNCPNLRRLTVASNSLRAKKKIAISPQTINKFLYSFKDQMEVIDTNGILETTSAFRQFKNLKCLFLSNQMLKPSHLNKLVYFYLNNNNLIFTSIVESNKNSLKTLHLVNGCRNELNEWKPLKTPIYSLVPLLAMVPQLKNLVNLSIEFNIKQVFDESLKNQIKEIGFKCNRIKSLKITVNGFYGVKAFVDLFDYIQCFKALKSFEFASNGFSCDLFPLRKAVSPPPLVFSQLTRFTIRCEASDLYIYESFFSDIDIVLPNIQYLYLSNVRLGDNVLRSLSKLTQVVDIVMTPSNAYYDWPQLHVLYEVFTNCRKLLSFTIYYYTFNSWAIEILRTAHDKVNFEEILLNICPPMRNFFWLIEGDDRMFH